MKVDYYTVNELAQHFGVNPKTIYRRLWPKEFRPIRWEDPGGLQKKDIIWLKR